MKADISSIVQQILLMSFIMCLKCFGQRTLTIGGSITVWLTSYLTGVESTKQVKLILIQQKQSS